MAYGVPVNDPSAPFINVLKGLSEADANAAQKEEIRQRVRARFAGMGQAPTSIAFTPQPQPTVSDPMAQGRRTPDEAQASAAVQPMVPPTPVPQPSALPPGPRQDLRQLPQVQANLPAPVPQAQNLIHPDVQNRFRQVALQALSASPLAAAQAFRNAGLTDQDIVGLRGFGPLPAPLQQKLLQMGNIQIPNYASGTDTPDQVGEAGLQRAQMALGRTGSDPLAGPYEGGSTGENLRDFGPSVTDNLATNAARLEAAKQKNSMMLRMSQSRHDDQLLNTLKSQFSSSMQGNNPLFTPEMAKVFQDKIALRMAVVSMGPEGAVQEFPDAAQRYPELLGTSNMSSPAPELLTASTTQRTKGTKPAGQAPAGLEGLNWDRMPHKLRQAVQDKLNQKATPESILGAQALQPYLRK